MKRGFKLTRITITITINIHLIGEVRFSFRPIAYSFNNIALKDHLFTIIIITTITTIIIASFISIIIVITDSILIPTAI